MDLGNDVAGALDEKRAEWARLDKARARADGDQAQVVDGHIEGCDDDKWTQGRT